MSPLPVARGALEAVDVEDVVGGAHHEVRRAEVARAPRALGREQPARGTVGLSIDYGSPFSARDHPSVMFCLLARCVFARPAELPIDIARMVASLLFGASKSGLLGNRRGVPTSGSRPWNPALDPWYQTPGSSPLISALMPLRSRNVCVMIHTRQLDDRCSMNERIDGG